MHSADITLIRTLNENASYYSSLEIKMLRRGKPIWNCSLIRKKVWMEPSAQGYLEWGCLALTVLTP